MQEKCTTIFERFPESEGLKNIKTWLIGTGFVWESIPGDTCLRIPYDASVLRALQNPSVRNPNLFIRRSTSSTSSHIYVSISNLAREHITDPTVLEEVLAQVKTFHEEQIIPGDIVFDPEKYPITKGGVHNAFSDIAHQKLDYRRVRDGGRSLTSLTLTKELADQLTGVFANVFPGLKTSIIESTVNPGFFRVWMNETKAAEALKKAQTLSTSNEQDPSASYGHGDASALSRSKTLKRISYSLNSSSYSVDEVEEPVAAAVWGDKTTSTALESTIPSAHPAGFSSASIPSETPSTPSTPSTQFPFDWSTYIRQQQEEYAKEFGRERYGRF